MFKIDRKHRDIKQMVATAFHEDKDLIDKYHIYSGEGVEKCVDEEMDVFLKRTTKFFKLYEITYAGTFFGFIGTDKTPDGKDFLVTFHLRKCYREKSMVKEFWRMIRDTFNNNSFFTALHDKNSKAVNFIMKNGGEVVGSYLYKGGNVLEFKID